MVDMNEGWGGLVPPIQQTMEERLDQLTWQMMLLQDENNQLQHDLTDIRQRGQTRGLPGPPPYCPDPNQYSVPRPPNWTPLGQGPISNWDIDDKPAFLGIKPILIKTPKPFKGEHDDMDRFLRDCNTYFEVFRHQFQGVFSLMVVFATSYFTECTRDWWTHHCEIYWVNDHHEPASPRYQYPHWKDFTQEFKQQFCDPAIEEVHEKKMRELRMGGDAATIYFQKLEQEAKLAGRWDDMGP